jgi:NhaP-type Na+/H+ or K+/H+ antiporter
MDEHLLIGLASIIALGVGAAWLAWRLRLPSILLLLFFGFLAGPVTGILNPDELLGNLLGPLVSLSVAVILYEGGLSLRIEELRDVGSVVRNLVLIGALTTGIIGASAAHIVLGLNLEIALLLGAIIVVTGPTVIIPLLKHVRPAGQVGSILRWEGIVIDPIGAMIAVLVFEGILAGEPQHAARMAMIGIARTIVIGGILGVLAAAIMILMMKRFWVPDFLSNAISLMLVVVAFTVANLLQPESGLLAATVMGVVLANQKTVYVRDIIEFKENLRVLLISGLFILLAARIRIEDFNSIGSSSIGFLCILICVARPAAVVLSTFGSKLDWRERLFLCCMAPRGIVAAAVSSVFALRLEETGVPQADLLVPLTFLVIVVTVALYGLAASPVARLLEIADPNPQGVLIIGAHPWARAIAKTLHDDGYNILLVDTNRHDIYKARMDGLPTFHANVLSNYFLDKVDLGGMGRMLALTSNDEVNSFSVMQFEEVFGRAEVYQLLVEGEEEGRRDTMTHYLHGRHLFGPGMTYSALQQLFLANARIKKNRLTEEFDYDAFQEMYGDSAIPLFLIEKNNSLYVFTTDKPLSPKPGQTLISLVKDA